MDTDKPAEQPQQNTVDYTVNPQAPEPPIQMQQPQIITDQPVVNIPIVTVEQPQEAVKGEVVEEKPKHPGQPSKYSEEMVAKSLKYVEDCWNNFTKNKYGEEVRTPRMPFIEELALELEVDEDTIGNWLSTDENGEPKHPQFFGTIKKLKIIQKLSLQKRVLSKNNNPTGAIFLLKANHGLIEAEKRIITGENNSTPLKISITEENKTAHLLNEISS